MAYMTHIERHGIEKGMQQGMQQGIQQGMQQAGAALILRQIEKRFHHVPALYTQRVAEADTKTLFMWGEKILDATTLEEIFADTAEDE